MVELGTSRITTRVWVGHFLPKGSNAVFLYDSTFQRDRRGFLMVPFTVNNSILTSWSLNYYTVAVFIPVGGNQISDQLNCCIWFFIRRQANER
jgi:hypothetical protein